MFKIYNNMIDMSRVLKIRRKKRPVLMELSKKIERFLLPHQISVSANFVTVSAVSMEFVNQYLCQSLLFNKIAGIRSAVLLKSDFGTGVSLEFYKTF